MKLNCVSVRGDVWFDDVKCPKHGCGMLELENGWAGVCWYCPQCEHPYELVMCKMEGVNKDGLNEALKEAGKPQETLRSMRNRKILATLTAPPESPSQPPSGTHPQGEGEEA